MTPKLIERGVGGGRTREIPMPGEEFLIGRGADCDLRLGEHDVSRHHCLIRLRDQEATLVDLGSSNGTYVNGERVLSQTSLRSGDEITLGTCRLLVDLGDVPGGVAREEAVDPLAATLKVKRPSQS
jgi:pSer/pThr/pTyr-binding forkhead associated (FHA) protein